MELACALVLGFVSLVTATPHGYGVKGGALAKADASAVAGAYGAFGAVPLSIPSGSAISGSYSKSSSSSFASSSASSSASSFNFNGANSGAFGPNGLAGANGIAAPGSGECTGDCQGKGNGTPDSHGAGSIGSGQAFSGAKAAAGSIAFAGSPAYSKNGNQAPCSGGDCSNPKSSNCNGPNCDDASEKCSHGQCEPAASTGSSSTDSKNKCSSGQCGPTSPSGSPSTAYTSDDIPVNIAGGSGSKSLQDTHEQSYNYDKSTGFAGTGVATGSVYNQPATFLTAPKQGEPCTSPNCGSPNGNAYDKENLPSSYNVPIHGAYPASSSQNKGPCTSGNCGNTVPNTPPSSYQVPSNPSGPSGSGSCGTGNCSNYPPLQDSTVTSSISSNYPHGSSPSYSTTGPSGCGTPNCAGNPTSQAGVSSSPVSKYPSYAPPAGTPTNTGALAGANAISGSFVPLQQTGLAAPSSQKQPTYVGGFGGPAGILKPNDFNAPTSIPISQTPASTYNPGCTSATCGSVHSPSKLPVSQFKPTSGPHFQPSTAPSGTYSPAPCSSGNCGHQPGPSAPHYGSGVLTKPTAPTGFGAPTGILKPNDFSSPSNNPTSIYQPTASPSCPSGNCGPNNIPSFTSPQYEQTNSPSGTQYKPASPPGTYIQTSCSSGNCGPQAGQLSPQFSSVSSPTAHTSGFGGPAGILNPNDYNAPSKIPTSNYKPAISPAGAYNPASISVPHHSLPSTAQYKPTLPTTAGSTLCSSGNCGPNQPAQISHLYDQSGLLKPTAPAGAYNPVACTSGNCRPQPGNHAAPHASYNTAPCSSGKCGPHPGQSTFQPGQSASVSESHYKPALQTGSYAHPISCPSGNCGSQLVQSHSQSGSQSGSPYKPTAHDGTYSTPSCTSGSCGSQSVQPSPFGHSGSSQNKPTSPSLNPSPCPSGNCGSQSSYQSPQYGQSGSTYGGHAAAGAVASASAVAYTGGFGGPPGLLKPYDDGKIDSAGITALGAQNPVGSQLNAHHSTAPLGGSPSPYGKSLNGAGVSSLASSGAQASAVAGASAGTYISGSNQHPSGYNTGEQGGSNHISGGCKGGCGPSGGGSSYGFNKSPLDGLTGFNTAGGAAKSVASAGAGSFGQGGSFASSSASAHASAGAATKGGYGRR